MVGRLVPGGISRNSVGQVAARSGDGRAPARLHGRGAGVQLEHQFHQLGGWNVL